MSGGLDSAVALYFAKKQGFGCHCLVFDYGQRHRREINSAKRIAQIAKCECQILKINFPWKGSSLLDKKIKLPERIKVSKYQSIKGIPNTYVPGRNIIFLSFAVSCAEAIKAKAIFIGAHAQDYSGYPDCRPEFYQAFIRAAAKGTKTGVKGEPLKIITPLIHKNKAQIIKLGMKLGVPFHLTWSCYQGKSRPCGVCDSCRFRAKGFKEAGIDERKSYRGL